MPELTTFEAWHNRHCEPTPHPDIFCKLKSIEREAWKARGVADAEIAARHHCGNAEKGTVPFPCGRVIADAILAQDNPKEAP